MEETTRRSNVSRKRSSGLLLVTRYSHGNEMSEEYIESKHCCLRQRLKTSAGMELQTSTDYLMNHRLMSFATTNHGLQTRLPVKQQDRHLVVADQPMLISTAVFGLTAASPNFSTPWACVSKIWAHGGRCHVCDRSRTDIPRLREPTLTKSTPSFNAGWRRSTQIASVMRR